VAFGTSIEMKTRIFLLLVAAAVPAAAQHQAPPGADPAQVKPLVERKDVVSWKVFAQVELVKMKDRYVPQFSPAVASLDQKVVKVQGFMMPLQVGDKQTHFVLSAMPVTCSFCMPGGPEALVEVKAKQPFKYGFEPITVSGKLSVLKEDPTGVFYRITDAVQAH
jgi:hypothetical protein